MPRARKAAALPGDGLKDWYNGSTFRNAVRAGYFTADTDIALSLSTDGFEASRQIGFQGWPVVATILILGPEIRIRNVCRVLQFVTPWPKQPNDLESFLRSIAEELNQLAKGIPYVKIAG